MGLRRPYAVIPMDLGSDGNSGFHALERLWKLNVDQFNDQNHGVQRDWDNMLCELNAKGLMVLNTVRYNLAHGPRKGEDLRLHQFKDCLKKAYAKLPEALPLFGPHQTAIMKSIEALGQQLPGIDSPQKEILEWLRENAMLRTGGRRVHFLAFARDHMH